MHSPRVSLVTSVYNHKPFLAERILSIQRQSLIDWEWWIADDCSQDGSFDELVKLSSGDSRIHVIRNKRNLGFSLSIDNLINKCVGTYLHRADSDDINSPEFLSTLVGVLDRDESLSFAACRACCFIDKENVWGGWPPRSNYRLSGYQALTRLLHGNFICGPTMLCRMTAVRKQGGFANMIINNADWYLNMLLCFEGDFVFIGVPLAYYRTHSTNLTASYAKRPDPIVLEREVFSPITNIINKASCIDAYRDIGKLGPSAYRSAADLIWHGVVNNNRQRGVLTEVNERECAFLIQRYCPDYKFPKGYGIRRRVRGALQNILKMITRRREELV